MEVFQKEKHLTGFANKVVFIPAICHCINVKFLHFHGITSLQSVRLFTRALFLSLRIWVYSTSFLKKGTQEEFLGLILTTLPWPHTSSSPLHTLASSLPSTFNSSTPSLTSFLFCSTSSLCLHHCWILVPPIFCAYVFNYRFKDLS